MSGSDFIFSNARVKAKEVKLLNDSQIARLSEQESLEDAFKLLNEYGYGLGCDNLDFDTMFVNAEKELGKEFTELVVPESGLEAFLVEHDYHNLKAFLKLKYSGQLLKDKKDEENSELYMTEGKYSLDVLTNAVAAGDVNSLSENMAKAIKTLESSETVTPHIIDVVCDKAMFAETVSVAKAGRRKELIKYFTSSIDIANISSFLRTKRADLDLKFFTEGFIGSGTLDKDFFTSAFEQSFEAFAEKLKFTPYGALVSVFVSEGLARFEAECDNFKLDFFKKERREMFSAAPIAGYYLGKLTELKTLKLLVAKIKNKVDDDLIKQRMRGLYA